MKGINDVKTNLSLFAGVFIGVACLSTFFTDTKIFPLFAQMAITFGINILPITRFLKSEDNVSYASRKVKQFFHKH